jgi:dUTP pyrophosphatase
MKVKFKKLSDNAVIPSYAKPGDAGLDLTATSMQVVDQKTYGYIEYGTGIAVEIPEGYVGLIYPRSSVSNTGLILSNCVGVVDSGYRGEIKFRFKWIKDSVAYTIGERIGQMIIMPYPTIEVEEVTELNSTERGEGGFGSSGK